MVKQIVILFVVWPMLVFASDPIPAARLTSQGNWIDIVGVHGGIPTRSTIFTNFTSANTAAQIQSGINACPSNQVVHCAAGTYTMSTGLNLLTNEISLRGDLDAFGNPTTVFNFTISQNSIAIQFGDGGYDVTASANWNTVTVNSGFTRGSTTVTLASIPAGCVQNALLWLTSTTNGTTVQGGSFSVYFNTDPFCEIVRVTSVSGNNVSFTPAINADFLTSMQASTTKKQVYTRSGLENLYITGGQANYVKMSGLDNCWVTHCTITNSPNAAIRQIWINACNRPEIRHNTFTTIDAGGSDAYAILANGSTGIWTEDNIFFNSPNFFPQLNAQNNAFSYNFVTNVPYGQTPHWLSQIIYNHGAFCCYNLGEGNWMPTEYDDGLVNNVNDPTDTRCNTHLRERLAGWDGSDGGKTSDCQGITILGTGSGTNCSLAGCLVGTVGQTTTYMLTSPGTSTKCVYCFPTDVQSTIGLYGNWNAVDQGVHSSEVLSGGQVIANSYLYASKPSFFGFLNWPPYDPSNGGASGVSGTNIPAGWRFTFGQDPPASTVAGSATLNDGRLTIKDGTLIFGQ